MTKKIKYGQQLIDQSDIDQVIDILKSEWLTQGPTIPAFENEVAKKVGAKFGVATNSATSALHIAYMALDLREGDWLWTCPNTFVATTNAAVFCGAKVDFVDIDENTFNIDVNLLEAKLGEASKKNILPKIVVPVHLAGQSPDLKRIYELSKQYGFKVVEDASHSIGAKYEDYYVGNCQYSDITVFSFHPVKIITTGEGGIALTNNKELQKRLTLHRSHGITSSREDMVSMPSKELWNYQQITLGYNYRMTDIAAGLGLSQLKKVDQFIARRHEIAKRYDSELSSLPIKTPYVIEASYSSFHLYVIRLKLDKLKKTQIDIHDELIDKGILVNLHYIPVYRQPYYQKLGFKKDYCPESENYFKEALSIPIHPSLTDDDQSTVISTLEEVVK